jgi:hypothetical protein
MTVLSNDLTHRRVRQRRSTAGTLKWPAIVILAAAWLPVACTRLSPPEIQPDLEAERIVAALSQANADLTRFKCVGRVRLSGLDRPAESFRAAMAGKLPTRLRIDMIAPYGGASGTVSADGRYLFLVRHASREYHKKRLGDGSLQRILPIDITVDQLLELLMGRIPMDDGCLPRMASQAGEKGVQIDLIDRRGRLCQRVFTDAARQPLRSEWFDEQQRPAYAVVFGDHQMVDGFTLPMQMELSGRSGERLEVSVDRYEPNAAIGDGAFTPDPLQPR